MCIRDSRRSARDRRRGVPVRERVGAIGAAVGRVGPVTTRIGVAVLGAAGRMGAEVCRAVQAASDLELVARLDLGDELADVRAAGAKVAVDFTIPAATEANVHALIDAGIHAVVGTTGWTAESLDRVRTHLATVPGLSVFIAPNFAVGAVLALSLIHISEPTRLGMISYA